MVWAQLASSEFEFHPKKSGKPLENLKQGADFLPRKMPVAVRGAWK